MISIDYDAVPRVNADQLRMLWIDDYYDGPFSGMLLYRGRLCRYECCDVAGQDGDTSVWRYVIRQLTDAQVVEEERWQALFVEHVGDHWTARGAGNGGTVKPPSEYAKFYDAYGKRTQVEYSDCPILGWFEM